MKFCSSMVLAFFLCAIHQPSLRGHELSAHRQWQRFFYATSAGMSRVSGGDFFLHPHGQRDLDAEMNATIAQLRDPLQREKVVCRFPARSRWLVEQLHLPAEILQLPCPGLAHYRSVMRADSVWVVFASYHLTTPASSFGHTFLRFSHAQGTAEKPFNDLLDYSVNFAANPDTDNGILYAVGGLTGRFKGNFSALPYYFKIREYNDYEARDLWSYHLNLSAAQREKLVDLIWELDQAQFDYYYLSKNCAYFLLALVEAVDADFDFLQKLPFYIIPIDTIKALKTRPDFISRVDYRPSPRVRFWTEYRQLSPPQQQRYRLAALQEPSSALLSLPSPERRELLDLALTHFDYAYPRETISATGRPYALKRQYLLARSQIAAPSPELQINSRAEASPDSGHASGKGRYALGVRRDERRPENTALFQEIGLRLAFHELEDPREGHFPSQLTMGDLRLRAYQDKAGARVRVHRATFLDLFSIAPLDEFTSRLSWKAELGLRDFIDADCQHCYGLRVGGAGGYSRYLGRGEGSLAYILLASALDTLQASSGEVKARWRLGPQLGLWGRGFGSGDSWQFEVQRSSQVSSTQATITWHNELGFHYGALLTSNFLLSLDVDLADTLASSALRGSFYF